ncbi:MAG: DUF4331 domain-containing protein [Actinobacteria bacterium]|nr:DUF4331 domain-containing protein [Actinomycetota bacterium]
MAIIDPRSNSGPKSFPAYSKVAGAAIRVIDNSKYFAGQRDDAFFVDLGAAFDNVNLRLLTGSTGAGTDTQADTSIQFPMRRLRAAPASDENGCGLVLVVTSVRLWCREPVHSV